MRVGIIGCGGIAPVHIRVYKRLESINVVALTDLNLDRAKYLANEFKVPTTFKNYLDMFEKEDLDLVDICTPVSTHAKIVTDAAKSVPAILVEKPMALNVSQCDEIIKEVEKHSCKLCIGHNQIFSPNIRRAKSMVDSGDFRLLSFRTSQKESFEMLHALKLAPAWNVLPEQRGIMWEVCCHLAYLQLYFLPDIKEVYAVGSKAKYPVYDNFSVLLRTSGECFGIIELSWLSRETDIVYELEDYSGRRLEIYRDFDFFFEKSAAPPLTVGGVSRGYWIDQKRILQKWARFGSSYFKKRKLLPTFNLISQYIEAINKGQPPPVAPEQGKNTIKLLECMESSLDQKKPILLKD
jgi:predicted dehydrogenase